MNALLWTLQVLLGLHTMMGALWKFSNSEKAVPSLSTIPHGVWLALIAVEFLCSFGFIIPVLKRHWSMLAPIAAIGIAAEMMLFSIVHLNSGARQPGELVYWLVVFAVCAFVAYGRLAKPPSGVTRTATLKELEHP